ncbi:glucose-1-phosphate adenylyltransferase [Sulfuriferula multivorans]|uniref:Glucose-1-phosphate adenylyltransferase n=1 Tax=Sulfuriferula multivorans TaxID=1559896 RepID=A0A401JD44_9PROT|nr:glucose-1-phosphate adenylyltransferase [Sulfuriferula multivorans]GBL45504.1 glucose-1-phosphate adenylyltransferase [Sulfuriferula multivorans]
MNSNPTILALVLAGGEGSRLYPLTAVRSKPSVPFGGRFRIVDFVLSNLVNSGIHSIYLLVQYKSQSLIEHVNHAWTLSNAIPDQFVTVVPPQMREGPEWFQGTADAVYQNLNLIGSREPDMVAVFGADHIYRMDVRQMVGFHQRNGADVSVAAIPIPLGLASSFGVITADDDGRVSDFIEKPEQPVPMPGRSNCAYGSMGNYLFNTEVLKQALLESSERGENDFGRHILPRLIRSHKVYAYDFSTNRVPGIHAYEEPAYWRDVGTIEAYYAAHMDLLGLEPRFNIFNPKWRIFSSGYQGPSSKIIDGKIKNSLIGAGAIIKGGSIRNSIVRREVMIEEDVELEDCIIMDYTIIRKGARLRRVIVDRYNTIAAGTQIGYDSDADRARYHVSESGLVVVSRGDELSASRYS